MSIAEMKQTIMKRVDAMSEVELEQLIKSMESRPEKKMDLNEYIRDNYRRVIEEDRDLLQRLAQ